jgi:hypothetical protein
MKTLLRLALCAAALAIVAFAQDSPRMKSVEPTSGKAGDEMTVSGENLDKKFVKEVYLTDGKTDLKMEVTSQEAEAIKAKVPAGAKPGRYSLMVLTAEKTPKLVEQPVKFTVEQ